MQLPCCGYPALFARLLRAHLRCPRTGRPDKLKPHSAWTATCTLSDKFNFKKYPKNVPFRGSLLDCSGASSCHVADDPCP